MSFATTPDGTQLFWEESGEGSPLLLIQGLGWSGDMWHALVPHLQGHRVIRFDARGIGRSQVPAGPYSIPGMADDAAAVLDAAGVPRAHVLGVSLGGIVAQHFALTYPDRVAGLILGCTHTGGPDAIWPDASVIEFLRARADMPYEESVRAAVPYGYAAGASQELIEEDIRRRLAIPTAPEGYEAQLNAGLEYPGTTARLGELTMPVLVFTGDADQLVPYANSQRLAEALPDARLVVFPGAGHVVFNERPKDVAAAISSFVAEVDARSRS